MLVSEEEAPRTSTRERLPGDPADAARAPAQRGRGRSRSRAASTARPTTSSSRRGRRAARRHGMIPGGIRSPRDEGPDRPRDPARDHPAEPRDRAARPPLRAGRSSTPGRTSTRRSATSSSRSSACARPTATSGSTGEGFADRVGADPRRDRGRCSSRAADRLLVLGDTDSALSRLRRQAHGHPGLPHGGRQPLLRRPRAGGGQPAGHRPLQRRACCRTPSRSRENLLREGIHPEPDPRDRQPDQGGAGPPRGADRGLGGARRPRRWRPAGTCC